MAQNVLAAFMMRCERERLVDVVACGTVKHCHAKLHAACTPENPFRNNDIVYTTQHDVVLLPVGSRHQLQGHSQNQVHTSI